MKQAARLHTGGNHEGKNPMELGSQIAHLIVTSEDWVGLLS
jgi:hypothetical protein